MKDTEKGKLPSGPDSAAHLDKLRNALQKGGNSGGKVMRVFNSLLKDDGSIPPGPPGRNETKK